jgi:hypothetical protein
MATILANVGSILKSLSSPSGWTVVPVSGAPREASSATESDIGEDITLGRKKSSPERTRDLEVQPRPKATKPPTVEPLASQQLVISPAFKLVLILVFVLIVLLLAATILLAVFGDPKNATLQSASSVISTAFTASVGAILGLIGGKAVL